MVDTPGFGDTNIEEKALTEGMMEFLSNTIDHHPASGRQNDEVPQRTPDNVEEDDHNLR